MYNVSFPGLGIDLDINNTITIGNFTVYLYGITIAIGLILAVVYGCVNSKRLGINDDSLLNCVMVGVITGIIGARAYYVIFNWDKYAFDFQKIIAINEGGLAIYGGIIGALVGGLIVAKICKMNIPALLDVAAIGFLIGQGIGRWGNFFNQEAFGTATDLPWRMVSEGTNNIPVHPCFLYESVWCLLGVLLFHLFSHSKMRKYHGQIALMYLVWYGAERAVVENLRTDSLMIPGTNLRVSMVLSILMVIAGVTMLIAFKVKGLNNLSKVSNVGYNNADSGEKTKPIQSTLGLDYEVEDDTTCDTDEAVEEVDISITSTDEQPQKLEKVNDDKSNEEKDIDNILNEIKNYME